MILEPLTETATLHARIAPISRDFLRRVREQDRDDLGQPVRRLRASGGEPCRDAFRRAVAGEELILASFSPFTTIGPYREYGPVFVLANDSAPTPPDILTIGGPSDYLREQFVVRAYSKDEEIVDAKLVQASSAQETIDAFFTREDIAFLHVRFPTYGCFACRLERPA